MTEGIRATVEFASPANCRIADVTLAADATVDRVWTSVATEESEGSVSEFFLERDAPPDVDWVEHVMSIGSRHLLRTEHTDGATCPCECLGRHQCAIQHYVSRSGALRIVFNAADFAELQAVMGDLREAFPGLDVRRLVRSPDPDDTGDVVFVDRGQLTARQREVLATAYRQGYFERPRRANASAVAAELDIDPSTFAEHLASAQRKLLGDVLEEGS